MEQNTLKLMLPTLCLLSLNYFMQTMGENMEDTGHFRVKPTALKGVEDVVFNRRPLNINQRGVQEQDQKLIQTRPSQYKHYMIKRCAPKDAPEEARRSLEQPAKTHLLIDLDTDTKKSVKFNATMNIVKQKRNIYQNEMTGPYGLKRSLRVIGEPTSHELRKNEDRPPVPAINIIHRNRRQNTVAKTTATQKSNVLLPQVTPFGHRRNLQPKTVIKTKESRRTSKSSRRNLHQAAGSTSKGSRLTVHKRTVPTTKESRQNLHQTKVPTMKASKRNLKQRAVQQKTKESRVTAHPKTVTTTKSSKGNLQQKTLLTKKESRPTAQSKTTTTTKTSRRTLYQSSGTTSKGSKTTSVPTKKTTTQKLQQATVVSKKGSKPTAQQKTMPTTKASRRNLQQTTTKKSKSTTLNTAVPKTKASRRNLQQTTKLTTKKTTIHQTTTKGSKKDSKPNIQKRKVPSKKGSGQNLRSNSLTKIKEFKRNVHQTTVPRINE